MFSGFVSTPVGPDWAAKARGVGAVEKDGDRPVMPARARISRPLGPGFPGPCRALDRRRRRGPRGSGRCSSGQGGVRGGRWCAARRLGDASEAASSTAKKASLSEVFFSMKDVLKS